MNRIVGLLILAWFSLYGWLPSVCAQNGPETDVLAASRALMQDGHFRQAVTSLTARVQAASHDRDRAEAVLLLAQAYSETRQHSELFELVKRSEILLRDTGYHLDGVLWMARSLFAQGNARAALDLISVQQLPEPGTMVSGALLRLKARCFMMLNQTEDAVGLLESLRESGAPLTQDSQLDLAAVWLLTGREAAGEALLRDLSARADKTYAVQAARLWLAERVLASGGEREAIYWLDRIVNLGSEIQTDVMVEALAGMARAHERTGNYTNAIQVLVRQEPMLTSSKDLQKNRILRARLLIRAGDYTGGAALLRRQLAIGTPDELATSSLLFLAEAMTENGMHAEAERVYQEYLETFTDVVGRDRALLGRAWAYYHQRLFSEASGAFMHAEAECSDPLLRKEARFKAADAYFAGAQYRSARDQYIEYSRLYPGDALLPQAMFQAALALDRLGEEDKALAELELLYTLFPEHALAERAIMQIADIHDQRGFPSLAADALSRYIVLYANGAYRARALLERGVHFYVAGLYAQALDDFETVVRESPEDPAGERAFYMRGWSLYQQERTQEALEICSQFLTKFPRSAFASEVRFWLAEYHYNTGNFEEATRQFQEAATRATDPVLADRALLWSGRSAMEQKQYTQAIKFFDRLANQNPPSPRQAEALYHQADSLTLLGDFPAAILVYDRVIRQFPGSYLALVALGRKGDCLFSMSETDASRLPDAIQCWRVVSDDPQVTTEMKMQAEYKLARTHRRMGDRQKALDSCLNLVYSYEAIRRASGPGADVWFVRAAFDAAEMLEETSQWRQAINVYQRVVDAGVGAAAVKEAGARISKIRREQFILF